MSIIVERQAVKPPVSPADWADYLGGKLDGQAVEAAKWNDYYDGIHQSLFTQEKTKRAFGTLLDAFADNFCGLVVDSVSERLKVDGFRMTDDPAADVDAWRIWQANDMDAQAGIAHTEALVSARSSIIVWADTDGQPLLSIEDSAEVACSYDPAVSRSTPRVALKRWQDEWGGWHAVLYGPQAVVQMVGKSRSGRWDLANATIAPNPLGIVPVVEMVNRPRLRRAGSSEIAPIAPIQDALNKVVRDALLASEFAAYPQRYVTGLEIELDENGQPKPPPFDLALDKLLQAADPNASFGQFSAADLSNYVTLIEALIQHLATLSRTPFHYFLLNGGQAPSGEAIASAEAGLVAKVRDRQVHFGDAWERSMRLAFAVLDDPRASASSAETIWSDPEYRTEGMHIDALLKKKALGVPMLQLWEDAGYSPQQVERFPKLREALRLADPQIAEDDEPDGDSSSDSPDDSNSSGDSLRPSRT